ncbi:hypothetical protein CVIRNUC_007917 [Coccomyxa viridis]|uniref:Photosystem I reaction center subunit XI, chloroplastic n=1 Tax=Coccomyxa viridis TaxID=1274662 RepID=A0AAV1IBK0_9CHLO|nr:hypothetical protein CVIRNUC_007917 [Coccomyxa viridis]
MQVAATSSALAVPCASTRLAGSRSSLGSIAGLTPVFRTRNSRAAVIVRAEKSQVVQPINGDPFIGMLETPVTSSPLVAGFLSNLPAYRIGVSPLLRGVEIGLVHGLLVTGPFIKLGPLRNVGEGVAERAGCLSAAGLVVILTVALTIYGAAAFQAGETSLGVKTLSGRELQRDPLQTAAGWQKFAAGWLVGGLSGVTWAYILTQTLPYYR